MNRFKGLPPKLLCGLVLAALLLTILWTSVLYQLLIAPDHLASSSGPSEGYVWTVVRYQRAYSEFERQLLLMADGRDMDVAELKLRHQNLVAAFGILTRPSELSAYFVGIPAYDQAVSSLTSMMNLVDRTMAEWPAAPFTVDLLLEGLQKNGPQVNVLLNSFRLIEMEQRDRAYRDFIEKRHTLLLVSVAMLALFLLSVLQLAVVMRKRREVIQQQRDAILAERRATQQAMETLAARNTLLGMVSHELRTPLQVIMASVEVLMGKDPQDAQRRLIRRIDSAAEQLLRVVTDLTDYAQLEAGKLELKWMEGDVGDLVHDLVEDMRPLAEEKGLKLSCAIAREPVRVWSDPQRLRQIVGNLVSNAIRYTDSGGVTVAVALAPSDPEWRSGKALHISVTDTGPGIAEKDQETIFEPFTRLDPSNTRRHGGIGMGLSIVRELTRAFGGTIQVSSETGRGSTFRVRLPCGAPLSMDDGPAASASEEIMVPQQLAGCRVLVIDDNILAREALTGLLGEFGVLSDQGGNANDAYRALVAERYDAMLLDIAMPGTDGTIVAAWLRRNTGPNQLIPVIAVSAYLPQWMAVNDHLHFDAYLAKPVRAHELAATLDGVLQRSAR